MAGIADAINKAQAAAGEIIDAEVTAVTTHRSTEPVTYQKPSMETMGNTGGISSVVDDWLKVSEDGLKIGDNKGLVDSIEGEILMVEDEGFFVKQSIKWGNPVNYASTYDGRVSDRGGSWPDQVEKVQRIDPNARAFPSADIIITLTAPVKLKDVTIAAGTKIGTTLSMSNWRDWAEFYRDVQKAGLMGEPVDAVISAVAVTGKKNNLTWGILNFALAQDAAASKAA